jgi:hypothetical protein
VSSSLNDCDNGVDEQNQYFKVADLVEEKGPIPQEPGIL